MLHGCNDLLILAFTLTNTSYQPVIDVQKFDYHGCCDDDDDETEWWWCDILLQVVEPVNQQLEQQQLRVASPVTAALADYRHETIPAQAHLSQVSNIPRATSFTYPRFPRPPLVKQCEERTVVL